MRILYFAWLRERLNRADEDVTPPADVTTVSQLLDWMCANDEAAEMAFSDRRLIRAAVDEELVDHDQSIRGTKTIALFPPMTGG